MSEKKPTVGEPVAFLKQFPADATWWVYEGEVSGVIVSHRDVSRIAHNDGRYNGPNPTDGRRRRRR